MIEVKVTPEARTNKKIVTPYAEIIESPTASPSYWNIHYLDPTDGKIHIGFGSYNREYVEEWLKSEFEVYDIRDGNPDPDAELRAALSALAEAAARKYPGAVKVCITTEAGCADLEIVQTEICDYRRGH